MKVFYFPLKFFIFVHKFLFYYLIYGYKPAHNASTNMSSDFFILLPSNLLPETIHPFLLVSLLPDFIPLRSPRLFSHIPIFPLLILIFNILFIHIFCKINDSTHMIFICYIRSKYFISIHRSF